MLEVRRLSGGYGRTQILHGVDLDVGDGEVVALLGRNGTGKTTVMRGIMGLLPVSDGSIVLDGRDLSRVPAYLRARSGFGYVPQGRHIFSTVSVEQNLRYGLALGGGSMSGALPDFVFEFFPWLRERLRQRGGTLSGGEQQMLAIARVLVARPRVLLLDEPTEGLAPAAVQSLSGLLRRILESGGPAILLVEQNLEFALRLAWRGYVMEKGRVVSEGDAHHLRTDAAVARHLSL